MRAPTAEEVGRAAAMIARPVRKVLVTVFQIVAVIFVLFIAANVLKGLVEEI
jgi:hypothetical protein